MTNRPGQEVNKTTPRASVRYVALTMFCLSKEPAGLANSFLSCFD